MKVKLEQSGLTNRGIILESETSEEKQVLRNIWEQKGRPVCLAKIGHRTEGSLELVIAPTPEPELVGKIARLSPTLDKAVEKLTPLTKDANWIIDSDLKDAINLGIEALQYIKRSRTFGEYPVCQLLPGETN